MVKSHANKGVDLKYRAEIDGLRALAVVPVILFHAGFEFFSGGYVGVDVFFVISGYLITSILIEEIEHNRFSIKTFYERRARRILPALFFVTLACVPFAWMWMIPLQMKDFAQSLIAVSLFASNMLFWLESGYFAPAAEEKPLLHTWSLAVEEQYYLLFPIFLLFAWRFGRKRVFWIFFVLAALSLALSEWGWRNMATANFYLAPTRVWELFAGSIAAFIVQQRGIKASNTLSLLGLAAIIYAIFVYDAKTPFPSLYALVPVIGVVLLILFATKETITAKILSTKIFVATGLISYSAYLWHQPIFAFARIRLSSEPSNGIKISLIVLSIGLAIFSWRYVERPFRLKTTSTRKVVIMSICYFITSLFIGFLLLGVERNTYFQIKYPHFKEDKTSNKVWNSVECVGFELREGVASCVKSPTVEDFKVVIWGDSHAQVLRPMTPEMEKIEIFNLAHNGCPPLVNLVRFDGIGNATNCSDQKTLSYYADYVNSLNPDVVILVGRWSLYINGLVRNGALQADHHFLKSGGYDARDIVQNKDIRKEILIEAFSNTLDKLNAPVIAILDQPMDYGYTNFYNIIRNVAIEKDNSREWNEGRYEVFGKLEKSELLKTNDVICHGELCEIRRDGYKIYSDDNHLNQFGTTILWKNLLKPYIQKISNL